MYKKENTQRFEFPSPSAVTNAMLYSQAKPTAAATATAAAAPTTVPIVGVLVPEPTCRARPKLWPATTTTVWHETNRKFIRASYKIRSFLPTTLDERLRQ